MTSKLVEELRLWQAHFAKDRPPGVIATAYASIAMGRAADELEAMRAVLAAAKSTLENVT